MENNEIIEEEEEKNGHTSFKILLPFYEDNLKGNSKTTHKCELCGKSFHQEINLKTHIKIHNGERPFQCTFLGCFRKFNQHSNLLLHEKTHNHKNDFMNNLKKYMKKKPQDYNNSPLNESIDNYKFTILSDKPLKCTLTKKKPNTTDYVLCGILTNAIPKKSTQSIELPLSKNTETNITISQSKDDYDK